MLGDDLLSRCQGARRCLTFHSMVVNILPAFGGEEIEGVPMESYDSAGLYPGRN